MKFRILMSAAWLGMGASLVTTSPATGGTPSLCKRACLPPAYAVPNEGRWQRVADCESGSRDRSGRPIPGSARWRINGLHQGGLQFAPSTWDRVKRGVPAIARYADAHHAPRRIQIRAAERWRHMIGGRVHSSAGWPHCGRYF